jgi:hypothetical protein
MKAWSVSLLVLMLAANSSAAAGLNLAWNNCYPSPGAVVDQSFICDDSAPGAGDANAHTFQMYGSAIAGIEITGMHSWVAAIEMQVQNATLDPWWQLGSNDCRGGAISVLINSFSNTTTCDKSLMSGSPPPIEVSDWCDGPCLTPWFSAWTPNSANFQIVAARTTGVTVDASTEYQLFCVQIDTRNTKIDETRGTTTVCAGCLDPACIVFNYLEYDVPPTSTFNGKYMVSSVWASGRCSLGGGVPAQRNYVTWQGGGTVPAKRTTWGHGAQSLPVMWLTWPGKGRALATRTPAPQSQLPTKKGGALSVSGAAPEGP